MARIEKLIERLLSRPTDFSWSELSKVLKYLGYEEIMGGKTGGSRRKFVDGSKHIISLHKPHPKEILKRYQLDDVISSLKERGILKDE